MVKLARPITRDEVAAYNLAGVVLLRGILDLPTVNAMRRCIDQVIADLHASPHGCDLSRLARAIENGTTLSTPPRAVDEDEGKNALSLAAMAEQIRSSGRPVLLDGDQPGTGSFLLDTGIAARLREFRRFALNGAAPEIAANLLGGEQVNFFGDQIFVKEPQTRERTAFHQDATYFEIEGDQCCVLWMPVDPVPLENGAMMYVRGSHHTGKLYQPNVFVSQAPLPGAQGEMVPNIEGHMDDYDLVHFEVEPGDVIVHHYRTVHGAGGNSSRYQVRRAASIRYCGDDIRFQTRPWAPRQLHHTQKLGDGDRLGPPDFPVVWRRRQDQKAA
jgi:hypothetical protein